VLHEVAADSVIPVPLRLTAGKVRYPECTACFEERTAPANPVHARQDPSLCPLCSERTLPPVRPEPARHEAWGVMNRAVSRGQARKVTRPIRHIGVRSQLLRIRPAAATLKRHLAGILRYAKHLITNGRTARICLLYFSCAGLME